MYNYSIIFIMPTILIYNKTFAISIASKNVIFAITY